MKYQTGLKHLETDLILNPTENLMYLFDLDDYNHIDGLYINNKLFTPNTDPLNLTVLFSGREGHECAIRAIETKWKKALNADHISMSLLSGLHAHTITFMGIGNIGDKVILLPENAGGHHAARGILNRLGYIVEDMVIDIDHHCIDIDKTIAKIRHNHIKFLFVDRSDGLNYEDFSKLTSSVDTCNIYDASQYITHILSNDYISPFDMGFHIMLSTLHKNFPGPQKAIICEKNAREYWQLIEDAVLEFVSSTHIRTTYLAGEVLEKNFDIIRKYSKLMLQNTSVLNNALLSCGVPIVDRNTDQPITQQIWITCNSPKDAYDFFKRCEYEHLLINYRHLPYSLGYGARLGTAAATLDGLRPEHCEKLAFYISKIYFSKMQYNDRQELKKLIHNIKETKYD